MAGSLRYCGRLGGTRMTLQIGLVGSDGIVLASDTCMTRFNQNARESSDATKILRYEHDAIAFAGDDCSYFVARDIRDLLRRGTFNFLEAEQELVKVTEERWKTESARLGDRWIPGLDRCVLAILSGVLWRVDIACASAVHCIRSRSIAGDSSNTARFFSELYSDVHKGFAELVFLAAHVVIMANRLNPMAVQGLEIVTYSSDTKKLSVLQAPEIEDLVSRSHELEKVMRAALYRL